MKRFCLLEISWVDGGPLIDILSIEHENVFHSLFCINVCWTQVYIELLGLVIVDTFPDEDGDEEDGSK